MGQHKQHLGMHHLVMGGSQYQVKKLCIWGLSMVIPFLVLFCIFPSGSSVYRPPNDHIVVSQRQVPPLHAARSDLPTLSSDEAFDPEGKEEEDDESRVSILDEPDFEPKKAKRHRGGKKLKKQHAVIQKEEMGMESSALPKKKVTKHRRKKESDDPIITPLLDKELGGQTNAEDIQPETSSLEQKINHDEDTISDIASEEETSPFGKIAANQDEEATLAAKLRYRRHKLDKEEEEEEVSPLGKEFESKVEDPTSSKSSKEIRADEEDPASSKSSFIKSEESNAIAAEDAVFFSDMEKTDDSIADAEAKVSSERKEKTSKAEESFTQSGKVGDDADAAEERPGNERASDLLFLKNADEEVIRLQSPKADKKSSISVENDGGGEDLGVEDDRLGVEDFLTKQSGKCRYYEGKWIIDSSKSSKDLTCSLTSIDDQRICAHEKNKTKPLGWRWQSSSCKMEHFQAKTFLKMMQNKSFAFVGDKLAKAQMESLLCLLAQVEKPNLIYEDKTNKSLAWNFSTSNFTISMLWSPHLVREVYENGYKKLHLDRLDTTWAILVPTFDVLILGVGSRFIEPTIYTVHNEVVGCSSCKDLNGQNGFANLTEMSFYSGFRATMRSALMGVGALPGFDGITLFLQPYGFEGNGSYHSVSTKMKDIQEEELYQAYKRGSISNQSKMEVLHTDFINMSKNDNMQGPTTPTCLVPSPLANTWNEYLQHTLTRLLVS